MKKLSPFKRICAVALAAVMLCGVAPAGFAASGEAERPDFSRNNAAAIYATGEAAFAKSDYDFSAKWIWSPSDDGSLNRWMAFRKDVTLTASDLEGEITAKIAADTKYWLW
ncbi:MAG: hypothetical protein IKX98_06085, partial [Clostridia bacterium]|nr:hypothetical protein [Clostridia bacterium]